MADQPADAAATAQAQNQMNQRAQAGQPTQPGQPQGDQPDQSQPQQAEHEVLLDLARQIRQKERTDNQVSRTVVFTEDEANAMADALEQLAPRLHQAAVEHRTSTRTPTARSEERK